MKKWIVLCFWGIASLFPCRGQETEPTLLNGVVIAYPNLSPLEGVKVFGEEGGSKMSKITEEDGGFQLTYDQKLPGEKVWLTLYKTGYQPCF